MLDGQQRLFVDKSKLILQVMSILRQSYYSPKYLYYLLSGRRNSGPDEYYGARDYQDVKLWFGDDAQIPSVVVNCRRQVNSDELELAQSRRGNALYNGVFNLLTIRSARDWIFGSLPQHDDLDDHHIVPKSWGNKHTLQTPIDLILNRTPLTKETNRNIIKNELSNIYLSKLAETNSESVVMGIMESYLITPSAFEI